LGLGYKTVANNCSLIKTKLGVTKTADLLRIALEAGVY
jgi:two-component system invasion response regulator UvrY